MKTFWKRTLAAFVSFVIALSAVSGEGATVFAMDETVSEGYVEPASETDDTKAVMSVEDVPDADDAEAKETADTEENAETVPENNVNEPETSVETGAEKVPEEEPEVTDDIADDNETDTDTDTGSADIVENEEVTEEASGEAEDELFTDLNPDGYFIVEGDTIKGVTDKGEAATAIVIPEGIKKINASAFQQCKLQSLILPKSLEFLGGAAFVNCHDLSSIVINSTSFTVGSGTGPFNKCNISSVSFPDKMTEIPSDLFMEAKFNNFDLVIPKGITKIGAKAFMNADGIRSLSFEDGSMLKTVCEGAFCVKNGYVSTKISSMDLPESLTTIEGEAFRGLSITEITIPKNVVDIKDYAFAGNDLKKIVIESVKIRTSVYSVGIFEPRDGTNGVETLILPEAMTSIPACLFRHAKFNNAEIVIPKSVTTINKYGFGNIHGSIKTFTFEPGSKLSKIDFYGINFNGKENNTVDTVFYVESGSYAEKWLRENGFSHIIAPYPLANSTVTLYFNGIPATKTAYSSGVLKPEKIVVKKKNKDEINESLYDVEYRNCDDVGTATVVITPKDPDELSGKKEVSYSIVGTKISDTKTVEVTCPKSVLWAGYESETKPNIKVKNKVTGVELEAGTDYVLYYTDSKRPGKVTVTIVGIGRGYEGTKSITYTIDKVNFKDALTTGTDGLVCTLTGTEDLVYNGTAHIPALTVKYKGKVLTNGVDYTFKYANNISAYVKTKTDAGFSASKAPKITVTGKGCFLGTWTGFFTISPLTLTTGDAGNLTISIPTQKCTGSALTPSPALSVKMDDGSVKTLKAGTDYVKPAKGDYHNNTNPSKGKTGDDRPYVVIDAKDGSNFSAKGLKGYFQIAPKANNIGDNTLFVLGAVANKDFTGKEVKLTDAEKEHLIGVRKEKRSSEISGYLEAGTDYTITYKNNINAGTATVTITGKGDYYGSRSFKFKIAKRTFANKEDLGRLIITVKGSEEVPRFLYTGYAIIPNVQVKDPMGEGEEDDYILKAGVDYTLKCSNNTNVSTDAKPATYTITFKGNYSGNSKAGTTSVARTFVIEPWSIDEKGSVEMTGDRAYNNGKAVNPKVSIKVVYDGENAVTVNPKAYKLLYSDNTEPGTAKVTIQPTANSGIKAAVTKNYTIEKGDISTAVISSVKAQTYKGQPVKPPVTVKYKGKTLKLGTDYLVSYENIDRKGIATITVTGIEPHFTNKATVRFIIQ